MLGGSVAHGSLDLLADVSSDSKAISGVDMDTTAPQCLASAGAISNVDHTVQFEFGSSTLEHVVFLFWHRGLDLDTFAKLRNSTGPSALIAAWMTVDGAKMKGN